MREAAGHSFDRRRMFILCYLLDYLLSAYSYLHGVVPVCSACVSLAGSHLDASYRTHRGLDEREYLEHQGETQRPYVTVRSTQSSPPFMH